MSGDLVLPEGFFKNYVSLLPVVMKTFCVVLDQVGDPYPTFQCRNDDVSSLGHTHCLLVFLLINAHPSRFTLV